MTASIVIHNTPNAQLEVALECLLRSDFRRIYILDNGTSGVDESVLKNEKIDYRKIANNGFGAGHNVALREVIAENPDGYHLVLNADVEWEGDAVKPLVEFMESHPDVGLVQPRIIYPDGQLQYTCRLLPTPADLFLKRFLPASVSRKRMRRYLLAGHDHRQPLNAAYLQGSFMLLRNRALLDCGLFDERFFLYPEDIDLTRRLHERWKTLYLPLTEVTHTHNAESRRNFHLFLVHLANMARYFNKWGWFKDTQRRAFNRGVEKAIIPPCGEPEEGRG
ncbi:MAG: glycosyltransferase family 2 protein [Muribaculaceae bacterium]|nr:glycosyltransferase family 2 protein [Muribaculaceae bacterium]